MTKTEAELAHVARLAYAQWLLDKFERAHGRKARTNPELEKWVTATDGLMPDDWERELKH